MFIAVLLRIEKNWNQLHCPPPDEWIMENVFLHTHIYEYYSAVKKNEVQMYRKWMDLDVDKGICKQMHTWLTV